jgi:uncharacterized protein
MPAPLTFAWDESKRRINLAKHGLDFAEVAEFAWDAAIVAEDTRHDYGEVRYRAWGMFRGVMHSVAFTRGASVVRVISFRRANRMEIRRYGR